MDEKTYNFVIVHAFFDRYTNVYYESGSVVHFTAERAREIADREKVIGYKLIVEQGKDTGVLDVANMPETDQEEDVYGEAKVEQAEGNDVDAKS